MLVQGSVEYRSKPRNVLDHAGYTAPTRQHELRTTVDHIYLVQQIRDLSALKHVDHEGQNP